MKKNMAWILATLMIATAASLSGCGGGPGPQRQLVSISTQPASAEAVAPDGTVHFSATGIFDQAPTTQANLPVQWASSDSIIATIDPTTGIATCLAVGGPVTVTASAAGKGGTVHGSSTLACQLSPDPVVKLDPRQLGFQCSFHAACSCSPMQTVTLTNVGGAALGIDSIVIRGGSINGFTLDPFHICSGSVDAGQSCDITVGFKPAGLGFFRDEVVVTDNAADSPQSVSLTADVNCIP